MLKLKFRKPIEAAMSTYLDWKYGARGKGKQTVKKSHAAALSHWPLMQPYSKGNLNLQHRIVASGITRMRSKQNGELSSLNQKWYKQRMSEGGLMVTESMSISPDGNLGPRIPCAYDDIHLDGLSALAKEAKENKTELVASMFHCGRSCPSTHRPLSPSGVQILMKPPEGWSPANFAPPPGDIPERCVTMDTADFIDLKKQYKRSAELLKKAGFTRVNVGIGGGGLLNNFMNASQNLRTDKYGGSPTKRTRFPLEIISEVSSVFGAENVGVTAFLGYNLDGTIDSYETERPAYLALLKELSDMKISYFSYWPKWKDAVGPADDIYCKFAEHQDSFMKEIRETFTGTVIRSGYGPELELAAKAVAEGEIDLVGVGRTFICVPDLPNRLRHGASFENNLRAASRTDLRINAAMPSDEDADAKGYIDWLPADLPDEPPLVIEL